MKKTILTFAVCTWFAALANAAILPPWFVKAFGDQGLNKKYSIIENTQPAYLNSDFNGDKKNDIAVQIFEKKTKKKGVLIINFGQNKCYIFGAGIKFKNESFDNTNWINGWGINNSKIVYETMFKPDGDIIGGKKFKIKYPAISAFIIDEGIESPVLLIYWNGSDYKSIHQGD